MTETVHAGGVARWSSDGWSGVLITGPSGVGKSDLILRLLEGGWSLVGDDRLHLWKSDGRLWARGPSTLRGLVEARSLGVMTVSRRPWAEVRLIVACSEAAPERVPERSRATIAGVDIEQVTLRPLESSAPAKLQLAWRRALAGVPF